MADQRYYLTEADVELLREFKRMLASGELEPRPRFRRKQLPYRYPSASAIRFELTAALPLGDEAAALKVRWNGAAYETFGDPIIVKDFTEAPGAWRGDIGYHGWAELPETNDGDKYEIIWMETIARRIQYTANETMGATTPDRMEVTVNAWWEGKQPPPTVIIADDMGHYSLALDGSTGEATYNEKTNFYEIDRSRHKAAWVRNTLTTDVASGETTGATVDDWGGSGLDTMDPDPAEDGITLKDKDNFYRRALIGSQTFSVLDKALDEYLLVLAETHAGVVEVTLNGAFSGGVSTGASKVRWYGSQIDMLEPPGSTVSIYDELGLFPRTRGGAKCIAFFDMVENRLRAIYCEQIGITATATLSSALTGGSTASITGFTITSPSPFNLSPTSAPTSANNPYAHRGLSGAAVQLVLNGSDWVVVDVAKVTAQFPLLYSGTGPLRLNANKLQGYMVDVAVELGATPTWVDLLDYTTECE